MQVPKTKCTFIIFYNFNFDILIMEVQQAEPILNIFNAASVKLNYFVNELFQENLRWLQEIQEVAEAAFGSTKITLLPKTPSTKRKRPIITKANKDNENSPSDYASTFVDGGNNKKLKIDDMSTILDECAIEVANESKRSLRLKNRKKRSTSLPKKRPKRNLRKSSVPKKEEQVEETHLQKVKSALCKNSPIIKLSKIGLADKMVRTNIDITPSPVLDKGEKSVSVPNFVSPSTPSVLESSRISSEETSHNVQPRVAALIEQLKFSSQKSSKKPKDSLERKLAATDVKSHLTFIDTDDNVEMESDESQNSDDKVEDKIKNESPATMNVLDTKKANSSDRTYTTSEIHEHQGTAACSRTYTASEIEKECYVDDTFELNEKAMNEEEHSMVNQEGEYDDNKTEMHAVNTPTSISKSPDTDSGLSSDENNAKAEISPENNIPFKIIVAEEQPRKFTPKFVDTLQNQNGSDSQEKATTKKECLPDELRGPKIVKPVVGRVGNIVTGVKSFINRPETPKKETEEDRQRKKEAEIKKKEAQRQRILEETYLKKQKQLEERKRLNEARKVRLEMQKKKQLEQDELRKLEIGKKAQQVIKNREELLKQREQQEKKKREIRELKKAEAEARRIRDEEEHRKKALEQIEEEERRAEMLQRKAEYEEKERQRKRLEHEKAEKERLRLIEEDRIMQEERKKREFLEKENHRLEVERKLKEEKERERIERIQQEERMKKAEREIEEAKKREQEKAKLTEKLREEIREQLKQEKLLKGNQFNGKVFINNTKPAKNTFKPPDLNGNANVIRSPAAHQKSKAPKDNFNPPRVPLMIRESTYVSYGIDDLCSDDDTDDECEPNKRIPSWAQGNDLRTQLIQQFYTNINPDDIFINCNEPCRLEKIFKRNRERYFRRTSSAYWSSPILKK